MDWLSSLIGGGSSIIGGVVGNFMNRRAIREQNKANKELAKYQYDLNMEAWRTQNEYNSPTNQVARLERAGLNPQLAYGNGQQAGNAGTPPQYQAPHLEAYQGNAELGRSISSGINDAISMYLAQAEADNKRANTELARSQRDYAVAQAEKLAKETLLIGSQYAGQEIKNSILNYDRQLMSQRWTMEQQRFSAEMRNIVQDYNLKVAQEGFISAQSQTEAFKRVLLTAQANQANASASLSRTQSNRIKALLPSELAEYEQLISRLRNDNKNATQDNQIKQQIVAKLKKDLDWYTWNQIEGTINTILGIGGDAAKTYFIKKGPVK